MADYPTSAFNPATRSSGQTIAAAHMNDVQAEIRALELALLSSGLAHHLLFVDATYDIGASGATRPRDLFLSRNATVGGTLGVTGVGTFTAQAIFVGGLRTGTTAFINDTSNAKMSIGVTINQDASDDEILALKSSDVAHGMTDQTETDTFGVFSKHTGGGGLKMGGFIATGIAHSAVQVLGALVDAADTTHTAAGFGVIRLNAFLKSGASIGSVGANGNLLTVENAGSTKFIVDAEGNFFSDDTGSTYSAFDDAMLALAWEYHASPKDALREVWSKYCAYNKQTLVEAGILAPDGPNGERGMVNMSALTKLAIGAAWQNGLAIRQLTRALVGAGVVTQAQLEAA